MKVKLGSVLGLMLFSGVVSGIARADDSLTQIAIKLVTQKFGISAAQVANFQHQTHQTVYEAAPVYSTSYYTHKPVNEVWTLRQQGLGWGEIAHKLGMNPGKFNKLRNAGAFDSNSIWTSFAKDRYGARESDIARIRKGGGTPRDILSSAVIARSTHNNLTTVFKRYQSNRDWERVSQGFRNKSQHNQIVNQHSDRNGHGNASRNDSHHGDRDDRDKHSNRGNGNDNNHKHGRDRGDDEKGHGNGHGNGNGNGNGHGNDKSDDHKDGKGHGKGDG